MQAPRGASVADYHRALAGELLDVTTTISLLDPTTHRVLSEITSEVSGGQVNFGGGETSRGLTGLEIYDPSHALDLDSASPRDAAAYADVFVRATQTVMSPLLSKPASVDVFTGPIAKFSRLGPVARIEADGKESRARTDVKRVVAKRGMRVTDAIEKFLRKACGETHIIMPGGIRDKLTEDVSVGPRENRWPWPVILGLADQIDCQAFYDGSGNFVCREAPEQPVIDLILLDDLEITEEPIEFNRVRVFWKDGRRSGQVVVPINDRAVWPGHPRAPGKMGRNGVAWTRTLNVEGKHISSPKKARQVGIRKMRAEAARRQTIKASAVPVWHLDPMDPVRLGDIVAPMREASVDLTGGELSFGTIRSTRHRRPSKPNKGRKGRR